MIIRKAKPGDSKEILHFVAELRRSAYLEMEQPVPDQLLHPISGKFLITLFERHDIHMFVAQEKEKILGFCMAVETPKISEARNRIDILELVIDEKQRGKGIGSAFLRKIETIAKKTNSIYIKVATGTKMKSNEFYKKNGYIHFENLYRKKIG